MNTSRQWRGLEGTGLRSGAWATKSSKDPVRQRAIRGQRGGRAALMRINIWIVLAVLLALLATTRLLQDQDETQRICADDPSASVCGLVLERAVADSRARLGGSVGVTSSRTGSRSMVGASGW